MDWYDWIASFHDRSLEPLYRDARAAAVTALAAEPGQVVLDLPCGTGQSFDRLAPAVGPRGLLVGIDFSAGMLAQAHGSRDRRTAPRRWQRQRPIRPGAQARSGGHGISREVRRW